MQCICPCARDYPYLFLLSLSIHAILTIPWIYTFLVSSRPTNLYSSSFGRVIFLFISKCPFLTCRQCVLCLNMCTKLSPSSRIERHVLIIRRICEKVREILV